MSASSGSSKNDCKGDNAVDFEDRKERNKDAENIKKCKDLITRVESGFLAIMKDLMKKCGKALTDHLKVLLECSICKGLLTSAVSRMCLHTFCCDCITQWMNTSGSDDCPICRDGVIMHVKNPTIDKVVEMLVDSTFTEKEKEERGNEIHQLSSASPLRFQTSFKENQRGEAVLREIHPDTSIFLEDGRLVP